MLEDLVERGHQRSRREVAAATKPRSDGGGDDDDYELCSVARAGTGLTTPLPAPMRAPSPTSM